MPSKKDIKKVKLLLNANVCDNTVETPQSKIIPLYPTEMAINEHYIVLCINVSGMWAYV